MISNTFLPIRWHLPTRDTMAPQELRGQSCDDSCMGVVRETKGPHDVNMHIEFYHKANHSHLRIQGKMDRRGIAIIDLPHIYRECLRCWADRIHDRFETVCKVIENHILLLFWWTGALVSCEMDLSYPTPVRDHLNEKNVFLHVIHHIKV